MNNLCKTEWKKVCFPVSVTLLLLTIASCVLTCVLDTNYRLNFVLDAWEVGTDYFSFLFPLFVVIPLCWNLYYERKDNFLLYVLPRVSAKRYLTAKWLVHAVSAFLIIFVPYMISAVFAVCVNKPVLYENNCFIHVFMGAYTEKPLLYAFSLSCWRGLIGVLVMTFGFVLAMYVRNIFLILTGPFIYYVLENFILSILRLEKYRLAVSFDPACISVNAFNVGSMAAGPMLLIVAIAGTMVFLKKVKKATVVAV